MGLVLNSFGPSLLVGRISYSFKHMLIHETVNRSFPVIVQLKEKLALTAHTQSWFKMDLFICSTTKKCLTPNYLQERRCCVLPPRGRRPGEGACRSQGSLCSPTPIELQMLRWSVFITLTHTRILWEEGTSTEEKRLSITLTHR